MTKILKEANDHGTSKPEVLEMTDELIERIARFNGNLRENQVKESLLDGRTIYTNFCKYRLFDEEPPQPVDDGGCDPLYGQRMDSADMGEC